jgi:hypothetical protein
LQSIAPFRSEPSALFGRDPQREVTMEYASRVVWYNHSRNQSILPLRIFRPTQLAEVVEIIREAERDG